jgi:hypothetical protein
LEAFEVSPDDWRVAAGNGDNRKLAHEPWRDGRRTSLGKRPARGGQPGEINSWKTFVWNHAPRVVERCRNWFALCGDALRLIDPATAPDGGILNRQTLLLF